MRRLNFKSLSVRITTWLVVATIALGGMQFTPALGVASAQALSQAAATSKAQLGDIKSGIADGTAVVGASLANATGQIPVMIQLQDDPIVVAEYTTQGAGKTRQAQIQLASNQKKRIESAQKTTLNALNGSTIEHTVLYQVENAYNGIAVLADAKDLAQLTKLPGVKALHRIQEDQRQNAYSDGLIGAPTAWASFGITGTGIKVGIIDTGLDYIHTNFGGSGLQSDYDYAHTVTASVVITGARQLFPTAKAAGGIDLAGDTYNARSSGNPAAYPYQPVPQPDGNPLDCSADLGDNVGHGSHVAGTAAGYGVNTDGTTYQGPYDNSTPLSTMRIGPGVAPGAQLYSIRVFGCAGSTNLTTAAIDWTVDPDGNPATNDQMDIVNLSLGSSYGSPDDPSAESINNAVLAGVQMVISAGNDGDAYYINGTPGSATRALTVANSADAASVTDGFVITDPDGTNNLSGVYPGSHSALYPWLTQTGPISVTVPVTAPLYYPATNQSGCSAFSPTEANNISGTIVVVDWATAPGATTFPCGSVARGANAVAAHAKGIIMVSGVPYLDTSINGSAVIPAMYTTSTVGDQLKTKLTAGVPSTISATLTTAYFNATNLIFPGQNDIIDASTSRGPQGFGNRLKPDIAAPGNTIFSTKSGSGNQGETLSGTSMAAPHMTGVMALLHQKYPGWTAEQYKAAAMNTADKDLFTGFNLTGNRYGQARIGAGRVDVAAAITNTVLAYSQDDPGAVSVSFGFVEAITGTTTTLTKTVTVVNKGNTAQTFNLSYDGYTVIPGVTYSYPPTVAVGAGATTSFVVTLTADGSLMRHTRDASAPGTQLSGATTYNRPYISEDSGIIKLTPVAANVDVVRVPVYAVARPASQMSATQGLSFLNGTSQPLSLTGKDINTGPNIPTDTLSLVTPLELVTTNALKTLPNDPPTTTTRTQPANIQALGITSNYKALSSNITNTTIYLGISNWANWTVASYYETEYDIYFDTNKDGVDDYVMYNAPLMNGTTFTDLVATTVIKLSNNSTVSGVNFINGIDGTLDTNTFNNSVLVMPIKASQLGLTNANSSFKYRVVSFDRFRSAAVDSLGYFFYDAAKPGLNFHQETNNLLANFQIFQDTPGLLTNVTYDPVAYAADGSKGILLLHHHNTFGNRAEVVGVSDTTISLTSSPNPSLVGQPVTFTATLSPTAATGVVSFTIDSGAAIPVTVTGGVATYTTSALTVGSHSVVATYGGDSSHIGVTSAPLTQVVNPNSTTVSLTSSPNPSLVGQTVTFTSTVTPITATGTVTFTEGATVLGMATVVSGTAIYTTSTLLVGSHVISSTYGGDATYSSASSNTVTQVVGLNSSTTSLTSSPNPSVGGQSVTFTATVTPVAATGIVTFTEGATVLGTATLSGGVAIYTTSTLPAGSHVISATYGGDAVYAGSSSTTITQVVVAPCAPLVVTSITDNGTGTTCGTLSFALSQPVTATASSPVTITFALTQGNTITFTGSLTTTAKIKAHVTVYGGVFGSTNRIIINGNGVPGDGLHAVGPSYLVNLTIEHFGAKELVFEGTGNRLQGVVVIAS